MGAQGWHRDSFSLHEERWFSDGQPTRLVRDQGAESYDDPPALPVSSVAAGADQLAPRLVSSRMLPARPATRVADLATGKPARNWRYWTVWPPCLLTLALTVLVTIGLISSAPNGSGPAQDGVGSNPGSPVGWILLMEAGLIVATVAAIVVLYVAADRQVSRRAWALAGWVIAALAFGWAVGIGFLSTLAP